MKALLALAVLAWPMAAGAQALVARDGAAASLACRGDAAVVRGSGNRLTFVGPCRGLTVKGSNNVVSVDLIPGGVVRIRGDGNQVTYVPQEGVPEAIVDGRGDAVSAAMYAPAAVVALPGPLIVAGPPYDVSCAGRDVVIRGDGVSPVLRGGCRSLTVEGQYDRITAELLPGAPVAISGVAVLLNYALVGEGPPPAVRTTVPGLGATQIQHFGSVQLTLPTVSAER